MPRLVQSKSSWHPQQGSAAPSAVVLLAAASWGSGSLSCLGGSGCQALQPASLTALITCLREDGQEGAGGDSCVPAQLLRALVESHIHPSGCH